MNVRWGLIGVGDIANKRVADAIGQDPRSELQAVCRRDEAELTRFADRFGIPQRFTTAEELIASPGLDAVYIATPVDCHFPQTIAAAQAGKHVLVEKPMALNPDECQHMVTACEKAGVLLGVAYYRRFYPAVHRIRQLIDSGQLGRILSLTFVTGNPNRFPKDDWRVIRSRGGGGPLMDIGSHRLDLFFDLMGDIHSVKASVIETSDYEAEQVATLLMTLNDGAHGVLQCYFGTVNTPDRLELIGTDGRVTVEDLNLGEVTIHLANQTRSESHPPAQNLHAPLVQDFTTALHEGRSPTICGSKGMRTNEVMHHAYRDAYPTG